MYLHKRTNIYTLALEVAAPTVFMVGPRARMQYEVDFS